MKEKEAKQIMRTELFTKEFGNFFVSTCYRRSSALLNPDAWYYETFAWKLDDKSKRTDWVADNSGAISTKRAAEQHFEVCRQLLETGKFNNS
jgi:hypothetical protein